MIRWLLFLVSVTAFAVFCTWLLDNDGEIVVNWLGYRIHTTTTFAVLAAMICLFAIISVMQVVFWLVGTPTRLRYKRQLKKNDQGLTVLTEGFAAIAAGDVSQAKKLSSRATHYLGSVPITKLLAAQTAQLSGQNELAKTHYEAMLEHKTTEEIAIKGLLVQAKQDGDLDKAIFLAEKALNLRLNAQWAVAILVDLYKRTANWPKAEEMISRAAKERVISDVSADRMLGVISIAKSSEAQTTNKLDEALKQAMRGYKRLKTFPPAIARLARVYHSMDNDKKALKLIESTYKQAHHPDLTSAYCEALANESIDKKINRLEKLLEQAPSETSGHIAIAKLAIDAGHYSKARNHLKIALSIGETPQICNLMAELDRAEQADGSIIDGWLNRAQTATDTQTQWQCNTCNHQTKKWSCNCSHCGNFDSLSWNQSGGANTVNNPDQMASLGND